MLHFYCRTTIDCPLGSIVTISDPVTAFMRPAQALEAAVEKS